jgi:hypothetical protein
MLLLADSHMFGNVMNSDNVPPRYNSNRWSEFKMFLMFCFSAHCGMLTHQTKQICLYS